MCSTLVDNSAMQILDSVFQNVVREYQWLSKTESGDCENIPVLLIQVVKKNTEIFALLLCYAA